MNCLILAAGLGTRLKPYTNNIPKPCLILKSGISIIGNIINQINKCDWVNQIVINTHYLRTQVVKESCKYFVDKNLLFTYEEPIMGTSGALKYANKKIVFDDNILIIYGDLYLKIDFEKYYREFIQQKYNYLILLDKIKSEEEYLSKGIIEFEDNHITKFTEKPSSLDNYYNECFYNTGIYFVKKEIFELIPDGYSDFGKDIFPAIIRGNNEINCIAIDNDKEFVIDIGTVEKFMEHCKE